MLPCVTVPHDDETEGRFRLPGGLPIRFDDRGLRLDPDFLRTVRETALAYGPAIVAPLLWGMGTLPEKLGWLSDVSARVFGLAAPFYDEWTQLDGYGETLEQALLDLRGTPHRILDVATGTGYVARRLKVKYPEADVTGVDVSPEMVAIAQHEAVAEGVDLEFEVADAANLPFDGGAFDLVCLQNALPFADELMRVTRPGGKALLVYSFGGPWVNLAWSAVERRLKEAGATHVGGKRTRLGYWGVARKRR